MKFGFIQVVGCTRSLAFGDRGNHERWLACVTLSLLAAAMLFVALPAAAQTTAAAPQSNTSQGQPQGRVIFSRSTDENGQTTTTAGPAVSQFGGQSVTAPIATDAERKSVTFTAFDMDVHLQPAEHAIAVRARLTLRNDGKSPLAHIPLQISSSLNWEHIRFDGRETPFTVATLNSDVDHTGQLHEAAITLPHPLAPGAALQLDVTYSGSIVPNAKRLLAIGAPSDDALHSDWDEISTGFTGLRGFGNVLWYPASSVPAILGDGNRVFDQMGEHKLRISGARFSIRLTDEFPHGQAPTVALINGLSAPLTITEPSSGSGDVPGLANATVTGTILGFEAPSLFIATRTSHQAANTTLWTLPADDSAVPAWSSAGTSVTPFLQGWLGQTPRTQLTILDLPDPADATFETGSLLVTPIRPAPSDQLTGVFVHALAHAWMDSPRAWLSEGIAHFMGTLWIEKQSGRQKALQALESGRTALALEEPSSPGVSAGQPLAQAIAPVYYRTKATYVFWMLRDLLGDPELSGALRAYNPAADRASGLGPNAKSTYFEQLLDKAASQDAASARDSSSSLAIQQAALRDDLSWFFSDWIDNDKGLPDIAIDDVFPTSAAGPPPPTPHSTIRWRAVDPSTGKDLPTPPSGSSASGESATASGPGAGTWIVAVNLANSGYAAAEIPIAVSSGDATIVQHVLVPARGKITRRVLFQGRPTQVQANDGTVPETEASIHITQLTSIGKGSSSSTPTNVPQ
jgi:hypothetical protein